MELEITDGGDVSVSSHARHDVPAERYGAGDASMVATLAPFVKKVDAMLGATLCENVQPLDCRRDCLRLMEAPAGNLVADVMQAGPMGPHPHTPWDPTPIPPWDPTLIPT
jgi:hypothetical protein